MKQLIIILSLIALSALTLLAQPPRPPRGQMMAGMNAIETLLNKPFIFTKGELQVSGDDATSRKAFEAAIAKSDEVIKEYDAEITKFLATNPSPSVYNSKLNITISKAKGLDSAISLTAKEYKNGTSLGMVYYLQKLYLYQGYLNGVIRIFPESQPLKDYLKAVTEAIDSYGSRDKFMDKMGENQKNLAKNLKMIPAQQSNPKVEAMVKNKYEATFKEFKVTKVNITYSQWLIEKNDLGIPLNKKVSVSIGVKNAKGECGVASANVMQEYKGGGRYGEAFMYLPSDPIIVPCENLK